MSYPGLKMILSPNPSPLSTYVVRVTSLRGAKLMGSLVVYKMINCFLEAKWTPFRAPGMSKIWPPIV